MGMHERSFISYRPLIGCAFCTVVGMLLGAVFQFSVVQCLLLSAFLFLSAAIFRQFSGSLFLLHSGIILLCAARYNTVPQQMSVADMYHLAPQLPLFSIQIEGRIAAPPEYYARDNYDYGTWVFTVDVKGIRIDEEWTQRRGCIRVRIDKAAPNLLLKQGQHRRFSGTLSNCVYPGFEAMQLEAEPDSSGQLLREAPAWHPTVFGQRLRASGATSLQKGIEAHPKPLAVYQALLLGYRKAVPPEIYNQFRRTGTVHIFAISGLHVGMAGAFLIILLKITGVSRDRWGIWLLPLLLLYVCATGMKSSALRAWTMAAVYFSAPFLRRRPDVPSAVAFAAILLLWISPSEILSLGFIFSFVVVSFLVMAFSAVPRHWVAGGENLFVQVRSYIASLSLSSIAAFIASTPLTALFFGTFSPVSMPGNLVVVPLTFCIVLCGWLSMLVPCASELFNYAAVVFIKGLLWTVERLSNLPGAYGPVPVPSWPALIFWYGGWITFFVFSRSLWQRLSALGWVVLSIVWTAFLHGLT